MEQDELYGKAHKVENIFIEKTTLKNFSEIKVPYQKCFWVENLLSQKESKEYIQLAEKLGFEDLKEFKKDTRNSTRCFIYSKSLASELWNRIKPFEKNFKNLQPYGITDTEGTWIPYGVDECFRISKYTKNNFFKKHVDSVYCKTDDERSILSILIYLNDDYKGGNTKIYSLFNDEKPVHSIKAKTGSALIFTHDLIHEGEQVEENIKYIIRVDVMFKRIDKLSYNPKFKNDSKEYQEVEKYMKDAFMFEKQGDLDKSVSSYLEGLQLQLKHRSKRESNLPFPYEIILEIFSFLTNHEIIQTFTVSREWNKYARDPEIWYSFYRIKWEDLKYDPLKDWYFLYVKRTISQKEFRYFIMDLGKEEAKFCHFDQNCLEPLQSTTHWSLGYTYYGAHMVDRRYEAQFKKTKDTKPLYDENGFLNKDSEKLFVDFVNSALKSNDNSHRRIYRGYRPDTYHSFPFVFIDHNYPKSFLQSIANVLDGCRACFFLNQGLCLLNLHDLQEGYVFYQKEKEIYYDIIENNTFIDRKKLNGDLKQFVLDTTNVKNFLFCDFKENYEKDQEMAKKGKIILTTESYAIAGASKLCNISHNLFGFDNSQVMLKSVYGPVQNMLMSKYFSFFFQESSITKKIDLKKYIANCYNNFGRTPLHIAAYYCDIDQIKSLINVGADHNLKEKKFGQTILHIAVSRFADRTNAAFEVIRYCVGTLKMDVNYQDNDGWTPLHIAYWKNLQDLIKYLEGYGAKQIKNYGGEFPKDIKGKFEDPHPVKRFYQSQKK